MTKKKEEVVSVPTMRAVELNARLLDVYTTCHTTKEANSLLSDIDDLATFMLRHGGNKQVEVPDWLQD